MDDITLDRLFSGDLDRRVQLPKRVVRLFISSTFTDMTLERNSLMERVYPRLKKYCREGFGLDFQVVDMRWGVRDEATDDHQTVNLCSREIRNCQRMSLGPNFVALLGDKYGFRPLCNRIKSTEYRALRRCLIELDINTDFLDTWYKEDLNAVPAEYLLQPISSILKNFTNKNEPELQSLDQRIWLAIQERLHELLMIGSSRLVKQGRMSEQEQLMKYSISVTEREVIEGCLDLKDAKSHCLVYVRSIGDLSEHLARCLEKMSQWEAEDEQQLASNTLSPNQELEKGAEKPVAPSVGEQAKQAARNQQRRDSRKASLKIGNDTINLTTSVALTAAERRVEKTRKLIARYIDLNSREGRWRLDEEAQLALRKLKEAKLEGKLASYRRNLTKFDVAWHEQEGISLKSDEHKHYINELTEHFYTNMTRMIRRASRANEQNVKTGLIGEVLQHLHYARHVSKTFHGRHKELGKIRAYILRPSAAQQASGQAEGVLVGRILPMFVYGVGGSGKTSILARASTLAREWIATSANKTLARGAHQVEERWDRRPCIIARFCGTTPNSSSIVGVLTSVCRQLQFNFYQYGPLNGAISQNGPVLNRNNPETGETGAQLSYQPIPEDFVRLVFTFRKLLDNCQHQFHKQRLFIIILDSVERLSSPAESSVEVKYSWLTSIAKLPANVRLIVSCSSEQTFEFWRKDYKHLKRHFLKSYFELFRRQHELSGRQTSDLAESADGDEEEVFAFNERQVDYLRTKFASVSGRRVGELGEKAAAGVGEESSEEKQQEQTSRYHLLKRVLVPAVRLMTRRTSKRRDSKEKRKSSLSGGHLRSPTNLANRWSFSGPPKRRRSTKASVGSSGELAEERGPRDSASFEHSNANSPFEAVGAESELDEANSGELAQVWILHVRPLGVELATSVIRRWLADAGRNLSQQQWRIVARSLAHCSRPIFVKLAFGEMVNWKSYSVQSNTKGLTFGSSLLEGARLELARRVDEGARSGERSRFDELLARLLADSGESSAAVSESDEFKWQILTMEQQWLNYLDYQQREQQRALSGPRAQQPGGAGGELVIRVGAPLEGGQAGVAGARSPGAGSALSASMCQLSNTIEEAICQLFARIELQHGFILTKHSLSYITAARNGICENELEDILSLDDVVLDDVFQYHLPPVRRIPPLLWTRIRNDLPDYLSERDADGIVVNWHHGQFKQVTLARYLADNQQRFYIHSNLADYFLGKWADKPKPFKCTKQQIQMAAEQLESAVQQSIRDSQSFAGAQPHAQRSSFYSSSGQAGRPSLGSVGVARQHGPSFGGHYASRLRSSQQDQRFQLMQAKADRRVPHQPLFYEAGSLEGGVAEPEAGLEGGVAGSGSGQNTAQQLTLQQQQQQQQAAPRRRYNIRKLTELPYHLMRAGRFSDLAQSVLFNYKWLFAAIDALGLQYLLADFNEAREALERAVRDFGAQSADKLAQRQARFAEQQELAGGGVSVPGELDFEARALANMLEQLNVLNNTVRLSCSSIHSDTQMLAAQLLGRLLPLVRAQPAAEPLSYLAQLLEQCDREGSADCALLPTDHCLQSPDGLQLSSLEGHSFAIMAMSMAADQRHLLAVSNRFVMWDISTGEVSRDVDPKIDGSIMRALEMGLNNEYALAYTSNNLVLVLDILTQQVTKFTEFAAGGLLSAPPGGATATDGEQEKILGLSLVDRFGATRFVVWTRSRWFVLRVVNNELHKSASMAQRIAIELEYLVDMAELDGTLEQILSVRLLDLRGAAEAAGADEEDEGGRDLACVLAAANQSTQLITLEASRSSELFESANDQWLFKVWQQKIEARVVCVEANLRQVVYADAAGHVYLRRRRRACWSRPKLLYAREQRAHSASRFFHASGASSNPLEIELEHHSSEPLDSSSRLHQDALLGVDSRAKRAQLARFERRVDSLLAGAELNENCVFQQQLAEQETERERALSRRPRQPASPAANLIKLYLDDRIVVLLLDKRPHDDDDDGRYTERRLLFPRNIRNISVEPNRCQIKSTIMSQAGLEGADFLVAAVGRRLLLYSLASEQFLKLVEAHSARIVQLVPILTVPSESLSADEPSSSTNVQLAIASASMDKSVKIWNLLNVDKDVHQLDKLEGPIESISLSSHRPLAACVTRGQLAIWDWRTLKLLALLNQAELLALAAEQQQQQQGEPKADEKGQPKGRIVSCKFSANGAHLSLATLDSIYLLTLANSSERSLSRRLNSAERQALADGHQLNLRLAFRQRLAEPSCLVRRLKFFQQDSRLLSVLQCRRASRQQTAARWRHSSAAEETTSSGSSERTNSLGWRLAARLVVSCHSVPDGRQLYALECLTPIMQLAQDAHYLGAAQNLAAAAAAAAAQQGGARRDESLESSDSASLAAEKPDEQAKGAQPAASSAHGQLVASQRIRLPVLTKDQANLVCVEHSSASLAELASKEEAQLPIDSRRKSSGVFRLPLLLNVYLSREGVLLHSINLSAVEMYSALQQQPGGARKQSVPGEAMPRNLEARKGSQDSLSGQLRLVGAAGKSAANKPSQQQQQQQQLLQQVSIEGDQFTRLKAVKSFQSERQSLVALLDPERGSSFLLDVQTKQLLACSSLWNGQVSGDGRFGLSRMFKSAALRGSRAAPGAEQSAPGQSNQPAGNPGLEAAGAAAGFGAGSALAAGAGLRLLEMRRGSVIRSLLSNELLSRLATTDVQTTGSDTEITCGFTKPNDAYVYFHSTRLRRLLLVRLADGELIANYKLASASLTKIKCSPDGLALVLGFSDGSLTSLAVVDPQKSDTLARLAQYPSRRKKLA